MDGEELDFPPSSVWFHRFLNVTKQLRIGQFQRVPPAKAGADVFSTIESLDDLAVIHERCELHRESLKLTNTTWPTACKAVDTVKTQPKI